MARKGFGCERWECGASTDVVGEVSFGTGELSIDGFWEFPCKECLDAWRLQEKWQGDKPITCDNGHRYSIKDWHDKGCPLCQKATNRLEITLVADAPAYDILCHKCNRTTVAIRPVNSEFVCAYCGVHRNMGEIIHAHMWKEMRKENKS